MRKLNSRFLLLAMFGFIICFSACRKEDKVIRVNRDEFSSEELMIIGNRLNDVLQNETGTFNVLDPAGNQNHMVVMDYLEKVYMSLVNTEVVENRNNLTWGVKVLIDNESENAFITPDGTFYITTGLLNYIQTEHELISVMGHEIMYADGDILINRLREKFGGDILYDIVLGNDPLETTNIALALSTINYSESEVLKADKYSINIICDFLYNPHGMEDFLSRVVQDSGQMTWTKNRPSSDDRISVIQESAGGCGPGSTFSDRYQQYIDMLP